MTAFDILNRPVTWGEIGYAALVVVPALSLLAIYWNSRRHK